MGINGLERFGVLGGRGRRGRVGEVGTDGNWREVVCVCIVCVH
jgi:hypothetical protein